MRVLMAYPRPMPDLLSLIPQLTAPLIGQAPWAVRLGWGSNLTLEFGPKVAARSPKYEHGEWHLWVHMAGWRVEDSTGVILGCEDDQAVIQDQIKILENRPLVSFEVSSVGWDTLIGFEGGVFLRLFGTAFGEERFGEYWLLFTPENKVLAVRPGSRLAYEDSDKA